MGFLGDLGIGIFGGSKNTTESKRFIDPTQLKFLEQAWGGAQGLAGQQAGQIGPAAFGLANQLGQQGQGFLNQLGPYSGQQLNPFMGEGFLGPQIGALGGILNRNLQQNLQGINAGSVAAGGVGSTRQGVAQGTAIGDTQLAFGSGVADILQSDLMRRQGAATSQAGIQAQTALGGLSQLGGLYSMGMAPFQAQWMPQLNLGSMLGAPTVVGRAWGDEWSTSGNIGKMGMAAMGMGPG